MVVRDAELYLPDASLTWWVLYRIRSYRRRGTALVVSAAESTLCPAIMLRSASPPTLPNGRLPCRCLCRRLGISAVGAAEVSPACQRWVAGVKSRRAP